MKVYSQNIPLLVKLSESITRELLQYKNHFMLPFMNLTLNLQKQKSLIVQVYWKRQVQRIIKNRTKRKMKIKSQRKNQLRIKSKTFLHYIQISRGNGYRQRTIPFSFIGDISKRVTTRRSLNKVCNFVAFVSQIEPIGIDKAIVEENQSLVIQEELNQFE